MAWRGTLARPGGRGTEGAEALAAGDKSMRAPAKDPHRRTLSVLMRKATTATTSVSLAVYSWRAVIKFKSVVVTKGLMMICSLYVMCEASCG